MEYNKDSFLAGIAVGRRLKGWAGGVGEGGNAGNNFGIIFGINPTYDFRGKVLDVTSVIHGDYIEEE